MCSAVGLPTISTAVLRRIRLYRRRVKGQEEKNKGSFFMMFLRFSIVIIIVVGVFMAMLMMIIASCIFCSWCPAYRGKENNKHRSECTGVSLPLDYINERLDMFTNIH